MEDFLLDTACTCPLEITRSIRVGSHEENSSWRTSRPIPVDGGGAGWRIQWWWLCCSTEYRRLLANDLLYSGGWWCTRYIFSCPIKSTTTCRIFLRFFVFFSSSLSLSSRACTRFYPKPSSGQAVVTGAYPSSPPARAFVFCRIGFSFPTARRLPSNVANSRSRVFRWLFFLCKKKTLRACTRWDLNLRNWSW